MQKIKYPSIKNFFSKYEKKIAKGQGHSRWKFYKYIFLKFLEKNKPIYVLETGTMWAGLEENMGAFTLIMADFIKNFTDGKIYTIDISKENIEKCKKNTIGFHDVIEFINSDSIQFLKNLDEEKVNKLDLIYLDSFDYQFPDPHPSAQHHLEELLALYSKINEDCAIAIDDNWLPNTWIKWDWYDSNLKISESKIFYVGQTPMGKGQYCHDFLIKKAWKRFEEFDCFPDPCIFYYEKRKLSIEHVNKILNDFYIKNKIDKPQTEKFLSIEGIKNSAIGLGDALILNNLSKSKFIHSDFYDFNKLMKFNNNYIKKENVDFFDIRTSDLTSYDWGGGHCIQRLEKAFLGNSSLIPKSNVNKEYNPQIKKVCLHFNGKTCKLENEKQNLIRKILISENFEIFDWNDADLEESIKNLSTCEFFIGINSGPMHIAASLNIKSIILLYRNDTHLIYLPKLSETDVPESEWLYPQNIHLSFGTTNELIEEFSKTNLLKALNGFLYPYFSYEYILNCKLKNDI